MLSQYYEDNGFYSSVDDEDEGESSSSDVPSHYSYVSANFDTALQNHSASLVIDVRQYLAASTSDVDNLELMSIDIELWTTSSSSLSLSSASSSPSICTTTTEYSNTQLPSFRDLLDYSPSLVVQPHPTDDILVPMDSVMDPKLRNPPNVVINRLPMLEQMISFQDHSLPNIDQDVDTKTYGRSLSVNQCN